MGASCCCWAKVPPVIGAINEDEGTVRVAPEGLCAPPPPRCPCSHHQPIRG